MIIECQKPVGGHGVALRNAVGRVTWFSSEAGCAAGPVYH